MTERNPYRLPQGLKPVFYSIRLEPDIEHFTFAGSETIELEASKPFSKITLHALDIKIKKASISIPGSTETEAARVTFDAKFETATLHFKKPIRAKNARIELEFEGELNDKLCGFYRTSYEVNGEKKWGAATQFEATDARRAFPCFDEPALKAKFQIALKVPKHLTALSNMPVEKESAAGEKKELLYQTTPVMPTYLVCVVIADLEYLEGKDADGVPIRVYTTPGKKEQARFSLEVTQHTLPYFREWFGIPYALPKLDMVALPDFASGAMENWGLITYRETAMLVDPKNSSASAKQRVAEVVDHELAHQWFGNLVTMEWWTDLWLNEGFASYMGPKAVDHQFPEWNIWSQYVSGEYLGALRDDSLKNSHPIEIPVKNPHEIREIFDPITYSKGSSVNRMLEHFLSEEKFREGLRAYLKQYAYGNATTRDLWLALEKASGQPVRAIMAGYTSQEGYPVLKAERKKGLELTQQRFIFDGSPDKKKMSWKVPVSAAAEGLKKNKTALMQSRRLVLDLPVANDAWVKINPGQSGFYRVAYSPELLKPLLRAAAAGRIPALDTLGVVDDAFALARAGFIKTSDTLEILKNSGGQTDYNVWLTIAGVLGSIENVLPSKNLWPAYSDFGRKLFASIGKRMGWEKKASDTHLDVLLRSLAIARLGHFEDGGTLAEARRHFSAYVQGGTLDPDLRGAVYSLVAEFGGSVEFEELLKFYKDAKLQEEKMRLLRALTRFRKKEIIEKVLAFSLSPDVRSQDTYVVLAGFGGNSDARAMSWRFVKKNWTKLEKRYQGGGVGLLGHILEGSTYGFLTNEEYKDAQKFFKTHPVPGTERTMKQCLEVIRANGAWARRDAEDIRQWLNP